MSDPENMSYGFLALLSLGLLTLGTSGFIAFASGQLAALAIVGIGFVIAAAALTIYQQRKVPTSSGGARLRDDRPNEPVEP
ncbi:hypothetical protein GCM10010126_52210 [Planomonospora parontospora]|uniref:Uncharacterized protein n=2 Tax=Planomonospora parontospora TaxID=58119 RepID=A0AA37BL36_9ACTN|nr:hypothetical protein [Planomonospora parontospora]GGK86510.1 hypothetical protein GCM10010126_52210 [Planomonospora parontospora]